MREDLELLAPVGSFEALKAAVQNGANAVYLGGKDFSARASANNFDREELKKAVEYAHIRDCRVFVTVNTLIKEDEKSAFIEYITYLYSIYVDAIILQDIGMANLIHKILPDFELHASTQMAAHSLDDVKYLEEAGFKRVVLARELNIKEIKEICNRCDVDIEIFVHGALCVSYSGQCLMSSELGTRSGNRGRCAQPCRQKYRLYDSEKKCYIDVKGEYLLSPKDLNTIENIGSIIESNVLSLKIEGRMKRPEYVATVVGAYREAIVNYIESGDKKIDEDTTDELYTIFNRKFTHGYLLGELGSEIMNSEKPNNRGLLIGKVIDYNEKKKKLKINLEKDLRKGDGLSIGGGTVGRIIKGKNILEIGNAGDIVEIDFIGKVKKGTDIFKTSDGRLLDRVRKTYENNKEYVKIPIKAKFSAKLDEEASLMIIDNNGIEVSVNGVKKTEKALKTAISSDKVKKQISKLGDTPYFLDDFECYLDDEISIPISDINNLRRQAIEKLNLQRIKIDRNCNVRDINQNLNIDKLNEKDNINSNINTQDSNDDLELANGNSSLDFNDSEYFLNVSCTNLEQLKEILEFENSYNQEYKITSKYENRNEYKACEKNKGDKKVCNNISNIGKIYYRDVNTISEAIEIAGRYNKKISYYYPRIIRYFENKIYDRLCKLNQEEIQSLDSFRMSNYGQIYRTSKLFPNIPKDISSWMNIINSESINYYIDKGFRNICLSQETSLAQVSNIKSDYSNLEYLVYGQSEMMLSEYCPMGVLIKDCKKNKRDALCNKSIYYLESSEGRKFRLSQDEFCRTTIYSDEVLNLVENIENLKSKGIKNFEISFKFESIKEIKFILEKFNLAISEKEDCKSVKIDDFINFNKKLGKEIQYNMGHLFKEID